MLRIQRHGIVGVVIGFLLLGGPSGVFAAMWDQECQRTVERLQGVQQAIVKKKQEMEAARVVEVIPSNFASSGFQEVVKTPETDLAMREIQHLFHNMEYILSDFNHFCLKQNEIVR